jgi:hypothetical protein
VRTRTIFSFIRIRTCGYVLLKFLWRADPGVLIRTSEPQSIFYGAARIRACGSGRAEPLYVFFFLCRADPGLRILKKKYSPWWRADPGSTDPGVRTVKKNSSPWWRADPGSTDPGVRTVIWKFWWRADPGVRIRASKPLYGKLWWCADPGVRIRASHIFLEACTLNFISGSIPDAWIQKQVVVSVKS